LRSNTKLTLVVRPTMPLSMSKVSCVLMTCQAQEFLEQRDRHLESDNSVRQGTLSWNRGSMNCNTCPGGYHNGNVACTCGTDDVYSHITTSVMDSWCQTSCEHSSPNCRTDLCHRGAHCSAPATISQGDPNKQCISAGLSYTGTPGCMEEAKPENRRQDGFCTNDDKMTLTAREHQGCQVCDCVDNAWVCHGKMRNRKEINDWSQDEFDMFAEAINTLKRKGEWDRIAFMHEEAGRVAHGTNIFLHWHRKYLFDLETMLQAAANSCEVTLPWWNWALDHGEAGASNPAVWGPDRYGALNITTPAQGWDLMEWDFIVPWAEPLIEQFGPGFRNFIGNFQAQLVEDGKFGSNSEFASQPLLRGMTDGIISPLSYGALLVRLNIESENNVDIADVFRRGNPAEGDFSQGFVGNVEGNFHNGQHCAIGGFMCSFQLTAPYDPVFYLHHAMVDKIWKSWQDTHLDVQGDERHWANDFADMDLPNNVCSEQATVPAADVEVSTHMTGTQYGAVNYWERQTDFDCDNFAAISCCMDVITDRDQWHQVARVEAGPDDVSDICSPMNPSEMAHNEQWLSSLVTLEVMTQLQVDAKLESLRGSMTILNDEVRKLPFDHFSEVTQCEKKLCMAITTGPAEHTIQGVCSSLKPECGL